MPNYEGNPSQKAVEKLDILQAMGELRGRLLEVNRNLNALRSDVLGEGESERGPEPIPVLHLDGRVFELFPILTGIEESLQRVMSRVGVTPPVPKPLSEVHANTRVGGARY